MHRILLGVALLTFFDVNAILAASLTFGCSGTVTSMNLPKAGVASYSKPEIVIDKSVVVDLDRRAVYGFWFDRNASGNFINNPMPITTVDPNGVDFRAESTDSVVSVNIYGSVDRITGKVDVTERRFYKAGGNTAEVTWDLRCKPTKPLF
jgi:hypothetical protein